MKERDESIYVEDMIESIEAIEEFSKGLTLEKLNNSRLKKSAITRELEILGEASKSLSKKTKEKYKGISWKEIIGTRNVIIHRYFQLNMNIIWDILKKDLPKLKKGLLKVKGDLKKID